MYIEFKRCLEFVINNIKVEFNLDFICKINEFVARNESLEWGVLRKGTVGVGDFLPAIPVKEDVIKEIDRINAINTPVERALEYFAYACKQQLFLGRKQTDFDNGCQ